MERKEGRGSWRQGRRGETAISSLGSGGGGDLSLSISLHLLPFPIPYLEHAHAGCDLEWWAGRGTGRNVLYAVGHRHTCILPPIALPKKRRKKGTVEEKWKES